MSEKTRKKKDGEDKNKKNQRTREANQSESVQKTAPNQDPLPDDGQANTRSG